MFALPRLPAVTGSNRASFPALWLLALMGAHPLWAASDPIDSVEKAAAEWVKTRTETVRLTAEWASQKELMEATVAALNQRAQSAEEKRDNLKAKTATAREEIAAVEAKNQLAADGLAKAEARLKAVQGKLLELRPSLPPRLSTALELS